MQDLRKKTYLKFILRYLLGVFHFFLIIPVRVIPKFKIIYPILADTESIKLVNTRI